MTLHLSNVCVIKPILESQYPSERAHPGTLSCSLSGAVAGGTQRDGGPALPRGSMVSDGWLLLKSPLLLQYTYMTLGFNPDEFNWDV